MTLHTTTRTTPQGRKYYVLTLYDKLRRVQVKVSKKQVEELKSIGIEFIVNE